LAPRRVFQRLDATRDVDLVDVTRKGGERTVATRGVAVVRLMENAVHSYNSWRWHLCLLECDPDDQSMLPRKGLFVNSIKLIIIKKPAIVMTAGG
jgi:hypothetical protein